MMDWAHIQSMILTHPGLSIATLGMVLSSSYVLLMLATKLGDVKPGLQSLVLSAIIHLVMAGFWGTLAIPGTPRRPKEDEAVPIRQVLLEEDGTPDQLGGSQVPIWDRLPAPQRPAFARVETRPAETTPLEMPERTEETLEPVRGVLPELPRPASLDEDVPQPVAAPEMTKKDAADSEVDFAEETADARPEVILRNSAPNRQASERQGVVSEQVQRESRKGLQDKFRIKVQATQQPVVGTDLYDEKAMIASQPKAPSQSLRTGPVAESVDVEVPGLEDGNPAEPVANGATNASPFTRVGRPAARNEAAGTVERSRPELPMPGNNPNSRELADATTGASRNRDLIQDRPGVRDPSYNAIPQRDSAKVPDTYQLRNLNKRKTVALELGATQESERAVELSLLWLSKHQSPEGFWDADGFESRCPANNRCWGAAGKGNPSEAERINNPADRAALMTAGQMADTGLTALVVLTYLGAGYTHEEGQYADTVDRAIRWMIRQQQSTGYLGGTASHYERMYCHGMATYALAEACGMMVDADGDPQLRLAVKRGLDFIIAMQNPNDGGWRYLDGHLPKQEGDMSLFGWQLMAIKSAEIAGNDIPEETQAGMIKFLRKISLGQNKGLASYRYGEAPKPSMTAEALFSRQILGMKRSNPASLEAIDYLSKHMPRQEEQDLYYWYYGTLAMYQYGGEPWRIWNERVRDSLLATQQTRGHAAGSWDPRDSWSQHGGRLYSTALSTLCLEVYYRFLPLYQIGSADDSLPVKK